MRAIMHTGTIKQIVSLVCSFTLTSCSSASFNKDISQTMSSSNNSVATITEDDIEWAKETVKTDDITILDADIYDLDFDGQDELLILSTWGRPEMHVFEKNNGVMLEDSVFGLGYLNYIETLELNPYISHDNNYHYFSFHFDNGGVMVADVLAAIIPCDGSYTIEYLLSQGTLTYSDIPDPFSVDFYRRGWNKADIAIGVDYNDLAKDQFVELYEQYTYSQYVSDGTVVDNA